MPTRVLRDFLAERGLSAPDGRPLYGYRCTQVELDRLEAALREALSGWPASRPIPPAVAQLFCLWGAEWWRRHHEAGPWRWEDMLSVVACEHLGPGRPGYARLCGMVADGLAEWKRPVLTVAHGRAFLVTLACEGGLPLKLILREQASLRGYFKALLEEFRILGRAGLPARELAERVRYRLPKSLQHDIVFELSGRLIAQIWQLQSEVGDSRTPVRDLDQRHPGWRDELPLRVPDDVARTLLNNLLLDAASVARGGSARIRWTRSLVASADGWDLRAELQLPTSVGKDEFAAIFGLASDDCPARFDLSLRPDTAPPYLLALGYERSGGDSLLALEPSPRAGQPVRGAPAAAGVRLMARSADREWSSDAFPGAAPLSDLPWVFCGSGADADSFGWAGEGSVRIKAGEALVAVPAGWTLTPSEGGSCETAGVVHGLGRTVYRVSGTLALKHEDGTEATVRTGVPQDPGVVEYRLRGSSMELGRAGIRFFLGAPALVERRGDGATLEVDRRYLQWKPSLPGAAWRPFTDSCVGQGRIRYVEDGGIRYSARLNVLPTRVVVAFVPSKSPRQGIIEFSDLRADRLAILGPESVEAEVETPSPSAMRLHLRAFGPPPPDVEVLVEWHGRGQLRLELPFPSLGTGFRAANGQPHPADTPVAVSQLAGMRAVALVPQHGCTFFVEGRLRGLGSAPVPAYRTLFRAEMRELGRGHFECDLVNLQRRVEDRLTMSDDVDAHVRLDVQSNDVDGLPPSPLRVTRYDLVLDQHVTNGLVSLSVPDQARLSPEDVEQLRLDAISLLEPSQPAVPLRRCGRFTWKVQESQMTPGPWLILGWQGDWCRARPLRWHVGKLVSPPPNASPAPRDLADVYLRTADEDQPAALADLVGALSKDRNHPGWDVVSGLLLWTRQLPPVTFELLAAVAGNADAAALAALRSTSSEFPLLWRGLETLPFWWWLVPRSAWERAVEAFVGGLGALFAQMGDAAQALNPEHLLREDLAQATARVTGQMAWLLPVLGFARGRVLGEAIPREITAVVNPVIRAEFLRARDELIDACPGLSMDFRSIPAVDDLDELYRAVNEIPEAARLLVNRAGQYAPEERFTFVNAPVISALCAIADIPVSRTQMLQLQSICALAPTWFRELYDRSYLYAFGAIYKSKLAA